jgi:dynein heavy chain
MQVIRLSHKNYLDVIESALSEGSTVLLENIGETVCTAEFQRTWGEG